MQRRRLIDTIERVIEQKNSDAFIGKITAVYDKKRVDREEGNIEVDVQRRPQNSELRRIPVLGFDHMGHVSVPQVGDFVLVESLTGRGTSRFVTDIVYTNQRRSPLALEGHWRHEFGEDDDETNVYFEAEAADGSAGEPNLVRMGVKEDGLSEPTTEVAVDNSGSQTEIKINTDGDIHINADGGIYVGDDNTDLEDFIDDVDDFMDTHTHDYTWSDDGGSGTTDSPN